ncbi:dicarboxylate/amino acid:cation symporter [Anoxynatronum sibiricum]|uniref:Dicarboxylate/amino acid:cation symporter n=1 Tax=Anoxynatronum sibiricum TaxID=210623 RepID=A0ABU9VPQ2_9CLOT
MKGKMSLTTKIMMGLVAGLVAGIVLQGSPDFVNTFIAPLGRLFLNLIMMIIVPLVFSSLIVGAASVGDVKTLGRMGGKTLGYYLITTAVAITIGLSLGAILQPGAGLSIPVDAEVAVNEAPALTDTLLNIIPRNPINAMAQGNMLQIIVFALFLGVAFNAIPKEKGQVFIDFFDGLAEIMYKVTSYVMAYAPIGVFGLITPVVVNHGLSVLMPLAKVIAAVYIGCILHAVIVYSGAVKLFANMNPLYFFKGIMPAAITAFSTTSSAGTLPVTIKSVRENLGVSQKVASFVLPLGATINMDGTALYQGVSVLFIAQVYGIELSMAQMGTIVVTATLASIGTAGVPGAGMIMLSLVLTAIGLPLDGVALVAGIDRILDMARTSVNVIGDGSAAVVVAATENELNLVSEA